MDARVLRVAGVCTAAVFSFQNSTADAAVYRTPNFVVTAPSASIAEQVGKTAEKYRELLAIEWLGKKMPQWYKPCGIKVSVGQIGAGGATTFSFDRGHVFGWDMRVQGSLERILDSVIPHEVSHTVFATHFRRPLPRWADEGAATLVEHDSEKRVQHLRLKQIFNTPQRIPLRKLISMKKYPSEMRAMLVLYAEGYSLADYLVQNAGKKVFLKFLDDAERMGWDRAIKRHYNVASVEALEKHWNQWVMAGSPQIDLPDGEQLAAKSPMKPPNGAVIRSQAPEPKNDSRRFRPPERFASSSMLTAPDPRRTPRLHKTAAPRDSDWNPEKDERTKSFAKNRALGRRSTLNAGWVPVIRRAPRNAADGHRELPAVRPIARQ